MRQLPDLGTFAIAGHELGNLLRQGQDRLVFRTTVDGREAVTRVLAERLSDWTEPMILEACRGGAVSFSTLPWDVSVVLEGYRARALLGDCTGLPEVLAGGLTRDASPDSGGGGFAWVTTEWIEGTKLDAAAPAMDEAARFEALCQLTSILESMHSKKVGHGDLKPGNVVVGPGGDVHLIDLDTLRSFPSWSAPVPTTDFTMSWAPPEMQAEHKTWLSSDIWALGAVAMSILTGANPGDLSSLEGLPEPWRAAVEACLRPSPFHRPAAAQLLRVLEGADEPLLDWFGEPVDPVELAAAEQDSAVADDGTVRVSEVSGTPSRRRSNIKVGDQGRLAEVQRLDDDGLMVRSQRRPAPVEAPAEAEPEEPGGQAIRWMRTFLIALLLVFGLGVAAAAGMAYLAWTDLEERRTEEEEASVAAEALLQRLREHKTVLDLNTRDEVKAIRDAGSELRATADSDQAAAVHALAFVWAQGWHFSAAKWNEEGFLAGEAVSRAAIGRTDRTEALLAHGILTGAACRLAPESSFSRKWSYCQESRQTFDRAVSQLSRRNDGDWLWVEVLWASVMVDSAIAFQHRRGGKMDEAESDLKRAARMCDTAWDRLEGAPINGDELAEDCISAAGGLGRFDDYVRWSYRVLSRDSATAKGRRPSTRALRHVVRGGHSDCAALSVDGDGIPVRPADAVFGGPEDLCEYLYYVAVGCPDAAVAGRPCRKLAWLSDRCVDYWEVDGVPWDAAVRVEPASPECLLRR